MNVNYLRKKSPYVMLLIVLLLFAGNYCVYTMPVYLSREICLIYCSALLGVVIFGIVFMLTDSLRIRSYKIFTLCLLLVGVASCFYIIQIITHNDIIPGSLQLISPEMLTSINVCACIMLMFFCYSFYHILHKEATVSSSLFKADVLVDDVSVEVSDIILMSDSPQNQCIKINTISDRYRFEDKIPEFKIVLEQWMRTEKPYLNKDFKLLDVMQVLPLNRSYLSRMFNEAYGETFFSFIMRHRIEESIRILKSRPDLNVTHIAQMCGFSSASVFGRAFLKQMGMPPKEYRKKFGDTI